MAHGDVAVVAAEEHLIALRQNVALRADAGVGRGLPAAVADGLDLGDGVRQLEKPPAAGEKLRPEVGPQAEAENRKVLTVDQPAQLIDLRGGHELALVHDDDVGPFAVFIKLADVLLRRDGFRLGGQADAALEREGPVALIGGGLDEPDLHSALFIIVFGNERRRCLGAAHRAIFEIKLCHSFSFSRPLFFAQGQCATILYRTLPPKGSLFCEFFLQRPPASALSALRAQRAAP